MGLKVEHLNRSGCLAYNVLNSFLLFEKMLKARLKVTEGPASSSMSIRTPRVTHRSRVAGNIYRRISIKMYISSVMIVRVRRHLAGCVCTFNTSRIFRFQVDMQRRWRAIKLSLPLRGPLGAS